MIAVVVWWWLWCGGGGGGVIVLVVGGDGANYRSHAQSPLRSHVGTLPMTLGNIRGSDGLGLVCLRWTDCLFNVFHCLDNTESRCGQSSHFYDDETHLVDLKSPKPNRLILYRCFAKHCATQTMRFETCCEIHKITKGDVKCCRKGGDFSSLSDDASFIFGR